MASQCLCHLVRTPKRRQSILLEGCSPKIHTDPTRPHKTHTHNPKEDTAMPRKLPQTYSLLARLPTEEAPQSSGRRIKPVSFY